MKKVLSLVLIMAIVLSLQLVFAVSADAPVNLVAPGVFTPVLGTNFIVSTRDDLTVTPDAFSGGGALWYTGTTAIFPQSGNYGSLWLAIDLGTVKGLSGAQFATGTSLTTSKTRISSYAVYYAEDIAAWNSLTPRNSPRRQSSSYDPSAWEEWHLAAQAPSSQLTGTSSQARGELDFEGVRTRYVLLCIVLTSNAGTFNIGDVRFYGSDVPPPAKPTTPIERPTLTNLTESIPANRIKASSESPQNLAINAFSSSTAYWNRGSDTIYPSAGQNGGIWVATDLGDIYDVYDVEMEFPVTLAELKQRVSQYEVFYSVVPQTWQTLIPTVPTNVSADYYPSDGWTSLGRRQTESLSGNTDIFALETPVQARYVLIYMELMPGVTGDIGLSRVRLMGTTEHYAPITSSIYPKYGAFSKDTLNAVSTSIIYNGNTLTHVQTNGTNVAASNYTINGDSNTATLTFNRTYLSSLPTGTHTFNLRFDGGATQKFTLVVADFGTAPGNLISPPIDPGRVWASTANAARPAIYAFSNENYWSLGANTVFPSSGTSGIYIAVDLGTEKSVESFSFVLPASAANTNARLQSVELYGATVPEAWSRLISRPPNNAPMLEKPDTNIWHLGGSILASNVTNTVKFPYPNTNGEMTTSTWPTAKVNLSSPILARYVMVYLNLKQTASAGTMGLGNLQIFGSDPLAGTVAAISPSFEQFDKVIQNNVSTVISFNGDTFVNAAYKGHTLRRNVDYTLTNDIAIATFKLSPEFLNTLSEGRHDITLNFTESPSQVFGVTVSNPLFSEYYLNRPGSGFAVLTPRYSGMSLTVGRPALIDVNAQTEKFPRIDITNAKPGTFISGELIAPNGSRIYTISQTEAVTGGSFGIPDSVPLTQGLYTLSLTLTNGSDTLYDVFYFTGISDFNKYRSVENTQNSNNANVANVNPDSPGAEEYPAMYIGGNGDLVLAPDYKGNQIIDFSSVGYKSGAAPIPNVPIRKTVSPINTANYDAWQDIQSAIDYVSALPLDNNGFRGTVYLEEGVFRLSRPLTITASGVVLRGAGPGTVPNNVTGNGTQGNPFDQKIASYTHEPGVTKLIATWRLTDGNYTPPDDHNSIADSPYRKEFDSTMINVIGGDLGERRTGSAMTDITDQYVGAGQFQLHVADTDGFQPGDSVHILRMVNADWARAMYMNHVDGASNWVPDGENLILNLNPQTDTVPPFYMEREIAAVDSVNNTVSLTQPLSDNLDRRWGVSRMVKIDSDQRISNVGVENIQGMAQFSNTASKPALERYGTWIKTYNDENHAQVFVEMANVKDGWMRNFTTFHLDTAFVTNHGTRNVTVQDGNILDPVSVANGGERRYGLYIRKGQFILGQRLYTRFLRHSYTLDSTVSGPNAIRDSSTEYPTNASEPHFRWSSGGLFENVASRIYVQNRWDMGTSHGHAGANYVLYNCEGPYMISQSQLSANYLIGHTYSANIRLGSATDPDGRQAFDKRISPTLASAGLNGGIVPNYPAYQYSTVRKVTPSQDNMPESIYLHQLKSAYGENAVKNTLITKMPPNIFNDDVFISIAIVKDNDNPPVIEVRSHYTDKAISTKGLFISDDGDNLYKWQMPAIIIGPGETIIIKVNNDDTTQTLKRCMVNFDATSSTKVYLTDADGSVLSIALS